MKRSLLLLVVLCSGLALTGCDDTIAQADLETFVEDGLTIVSSRSHSFSQSGELKAMVSSGQNITAGLVMINPRGLDVTYTIGYDSSFFDTIPPVNPVPRDAYNLSFDFVLNSLAEHRTISFTVDKYASSINKAYATETISILCDSPPNAPLDLASVESAAYYPILAFTLPTQASDDDLKEAEITWTQITTGTPATFTQTYQLDALSSPPSTNPYGDTQSTYRYLTLDSSNAVAGYSYTFDVTLRDTLGQSSEQVSLTSSPHKYLLSYNGNGSTSGTAPASQTHAVEDTIIASTPNDLALSAYAFISWNTQADGSGTRYYSQDSFSMPNQDLTLYAQWSNNGTMVSFDIGVQGLAFSPASADVASGTALSLSCGNSALSTGGSAWKWYADGVEIAGQTSSNLSWTSTDVGDHIISCAVNYEGETYSGYLKIKVVQ